MFEVPKYTNERLLSWIKRHRNKGHSTFSVTGYDVTGKREVQLRAMCCKRCMEIYVFDTVKEHINGLL